MNSDNTSYQFAQPATLKVLVVGDGHSGKTTYIKKLCYAESLKDRYIPTLGVEVRSLLLSTNRGDITLDLWDTAGQETFSGIRNAYYTSANCCIIFIENVNCHERLNFWLNDVRNVCGNIPIVLVHSKRDNIYIFGPAETTINGLKCFKISVKSNSNLDKPILYLMREFYKDQNIVCV